MYRIFSRALRGNAHERLKDPKYFPPFVSSLLYRLFFEGKTLHENEKIFDFFEIFFKNSAFSCFFRSNREERRPRKNGTRAVFRPLRPRGNNARTENLRIGFHRRHCPASAEDNAASYPVANTARCRTLQCGARLRVFPQNRGEECRVTRGTVCRQRFQPRSGVSVIFTLCAAQPSSSSTTISLGASVLSSAPGR